MRFVKMRFRKLLIVLLVSVGLFCEVRTSQEVVQKMSEHFAAGLDTCKAELNYKDSDLTELYNYWTIDGKLVAKSTGCMINCLSTKLDLLDPEGNLHHGNAKEWAAKHGADEPVAQQITDMIHGCMTSTPQMDDRCLQVLEVANCFKMKIHELKWAPDFEVIIEEVLAEV